MNAQQRFWLQTVFQNGIEVSLQLSKKPTPEQTPFDNKYKAIQKLKKLVSHDHNYKFIAYCILGEIYSDVEQTNDSIKSYTNALLQLSKLSLKEIPRFYQYFMICYNMLGLSFINRQDNQGGLGCLCKAYEIYQACREHPGLDTYHNRSQKSKGRKFNFYYEGGNAFQQIQENHTLTLFYLAQAYTKIGLKDKAAEYCGLTLKRQYAYQKFEVKQFCHNLIGLSQYYTGNKYYAQAQYILLLALKVLPEGRKKKMRALIQIQLGKLILDMLEYSCSRIRSKQEIVEEEHQSMNKKFLVFQNFQQKFPQIRLGTAIETCKSLFRKANTQLKKALQTFVLDGFVTEHIDILSEQSKLYKVLSMIQISRERVFSMLDKRRQLLQPLLKQLNPKAYPATWQNILVQVSQIYNDSFNIKTLILVDAKSTLSESKLQDMNRIGLQSVYYYKQIIKVLQEDKQAEKNEQYYRSLINSKFNIAKTESKLTSLDKNLRVGYLKESYDHYKQLYHYIEGLPSINSKLTGVFSKQLQLTNDMVVMMPNKIDKINYGLVSPLQ